MGLDFHGAIALKHFTTKNSLGSTLTIGRQAIHISPKIIKEVFKLDKPSIDRVFSQKQTKTNFSFCEELLITLGATNVDSLDASNYEGATIILDLNKRLKNEKKYDTIVDFGSSEHVYDVAQTFENYSEFLKDGGSLVHVLPANNQCGHGFYQFSPEFFYSLYSEKNGFKNTEIFMVEIPNKKSWFRIKPPEPGKRIFFNSKKPCYVVCFTQKEKNVSFEKNVQQSDYVYEWSNETNANSDIISESKMKSAVRKIPLIFLSIKLLIHFPRYWLVLIKNKFLEKRRKEKMIVSIRTLV
jgi:hypothetical protein